MGTPRDNGDLKGDGHPMGGGDLRDNEDLKGRWGPQGVMGGHGDCRVAWG